MKRETFHYTVGELIPYIDWSYFLHAWGLTGAARAKAKEELMNDAIAMLHTIEGLQCCHALFTLCDAHSDGDNIIIENELLPLLRQQHAINGKPNLCLSDFVSPQQDLVGLFATTIEPQAGISFKGDKYQELLFHTLADRLAEATATVMHRKVRTDKGIWGYAGEENLTIEQLNREEYRGIRPAVGYPSLPDQSIIFVIDKLLQMKDIGIELTPNGAMMPHSSVCGIMIHHPLSHYFAVGKISEEQFNDYALRHTLGVEDLKKFLSKNLCE